MRLLVVRHAIAMERDEYQAEAGQAGQADDELRPLTPHGVRKMKKNVQGLVRMVEKPRLLVSSPLTRAMQTAEILRAEWRDLEITVAEELKPGTPPAELSRWLKARHESATKSDIIAIVGHEPHLSSTVGWFLSGSPATKLILKKGGACLVEFDAGRIEKGKGRLMWLATPSMLRAWR